ncbi:hypothetical protein D3C73_848410 [compost metagenome]
MPKLIEWLSPFALLALCACTDIDQSTDQAWGGAVAAPGSFSSEPGSESLVLPASVDELNAYISRTGAASHQRGPGEMLKAPAPLPRSICPAASEAVVFSYPLQPEGFMPGYTAYIIDGSVVCIDRTFAYSGT